MFLLLVNSALWFLIPSWISFCGMQFFLFKLWIAFLLLLLLLHITVYNMSIFNFMYCVHIFKYLQEEL